MLCNLCTKNVDSVYVCVYVFFIGISLSVAKGYPQLDIEQLDIIIFNSKNVFNTEE